MHGINGVCGRYLLQVMEVNVRGVFLCMKYEIPLMLETGNEGSIVITSSVAGMSVFNVSMEILLS